MPARVVDAFGLSHGSRNGRCDMVRVWETPEAERLRQLAEERRREREEIVARYETLGCLKLGLPLPEVRR